MAWLFWQEEILSSATVEEFSFWTETWWIYLVDQNEENGADLLDLRFQLEGLEVGLITEYLEQEKLGLQFKVESGPKKKRGWFAQILQITQMYFCINMSYIPLLTSKIFL